MVPYRRGVGHDMERRQQCDPGRTAKDIHYALARVNDILVDEDDSVHLTEGIRSEDWLPQRETAPGVM